MNDHIMRFDFCHTKNSCETFHLVWQNEYNWLTVLFYVLQHEQRNLRVYFCYGKLSRKNHGRVKATTKQASRKLQQDCWHLHLQSSRVAAEELVIYELLLASTALWFHSITIILFCLSANVLVSTFFAVFPHISHDL